MAEPVLKVAAIEEAGSIDYFGGNGGIDCFGDEEGRLERVSLW